LQNAADHGFDIDRGPGRLVVALANDRSVLTVRATDDGVGLPEGFSLDAATGPGVPIVRTLVTTELAGRSRCAAPTSTISERRDR
jgi:two-component sensor histidine kinase